MTGINEVFADNPDTNLFGVATGSATFTRFPTGTSEAVAKLLRFKAHPSNVGYFELVLWEQSHEQVWPMNPGDDTGWFAPSHIQQSPMRGLADFGYRSLSGSTTYIHYWIQR
jgi:hypothetical protein